MVHLSAAAWFPALIGIAVATHKARKLTYAALFSASFGICALLWRLINIGHFAQRFFLTYFQMTSTYPVTVLGWLQSRWDSLVNTMVPLGLFLFHRNSLETTADLRTVSAADPILLSLLERAAVRCRSRVLHALPITRGVDWAQARTSMVLALFATGASQTGRCYSAESRFFSCCCRRLLRTVCSCRSNLRSATSCRSSRWLAERLFSPFIRTLSALSENVRWRLFQIPHEFEPGKHLQRVVGDIDFPPIEALAFG